MIAIDFQGGAHGNFLEFVCNIMADVKVGGLPFNANGASHNTVYLTPTLFCANHFSLNNIKLPGTHVIAIKIAINDLLPLHQISLLRAGDYGYDNDKLEIDTYNKLNNVNYRWVLDNILSSFFANQIKSSYDAVKDPLWPAISNINDFENLPVHIKKECVEVHKLQLLELSASRPNCSRHILREFFQIGFNKPENHGFIVQQHKMCYDKKINVYNFPFSAFYNTQEFLNQIELIAAWAKIKYNTQKEIAELHKLFLAKQPYKDSKNKCDQIIKNVIENNMMNMPKINLMEEAYVNAMLEKIGYECRY
jgi:hypothetical protein